ncbi:MAG: DEAD/DEAH box helicase [Bacteroidales bacterium]
MNFEKLNLIEPLVEALHKENIVVPTPIQQAAIPVLLEGKDILAFSQTGTGKTAAFLLPILQQLSLSDPLQGIKALVLAPTRELAAQIDKNLTSYGNLLNITHLTVYGGIPIEEQLEVLQNVPDILIATPGRLLDLLNRDALTLNQISHFVLDEADRMLDMGFQEDLDQLLTLLPERRQSMLFSATLPPQIRSLADKLLKNPVEIKTEISCQANEQVEQRVYHIERANKSLLMIDLLRKLDDKPAIIFTKTRNSADKLHLVLKEAGFDADRIHSDRSQKAREEILTSFRNKELQFLIATDIAARGIDIPHLEHVFNYELPQCAESYVHRIGRTGRAGKEGFAITLCEPEELAMLIEIRKLIRFNIPVVENHTYATVSLKKAMMLAEDILKGKAVEKKKYHGSKANGDYFRRQKREQRKQNGNKKH